MVLVNCMHSARDREIPPDAITVWRGEGVSSADLSATLSTPTVRVSDIHPYVPSEVESKDTLSVDVVMMP